MSSEKMKANAPVELRAGVEGSATRAHPEGVCPISRQPLVELKPHELYVASDRHAYAREALADYLVFEAKRGRGAPTSPLNGAPMLADVKRLFTRPWPEWRARKILATLQATSEHFRSFDGAMVVQSGQLVAATIADARMGLPVKARLLEAGFRAETTTVFRALLALVVRGNLDGGPLHRVQHGVTAQHAACGLLTAWALCGYAWHLAAGDRPAWLAAGRHHVNPVMLAFVSQGVLATLLGATLPWADGLLMGGIDAFAASYVAEAPDVRLEDSTRATPQGV